MSALDMSQAVDRFNEMPATTLEPLLQRCVAVPRWARELAAGRPYRDTDQVHAAGERLSNGLSDDEVRRALSDHPEIGERPAASSRTAAWSTAEQSDVDSRDEQLADALRDANVSYRQRFGHIYLVCASGRDGRDLLADVRARLGNDPAAELAVVRRELGKIAQVRLARVFEEVTAG